ncbi:MAG: tetratricopeptide repeat protein [Bacteroidota bacterium]
MMNAIDLSDVPLLAVGPPRTAGELNDEANGMLGGAPRGALELAMEALSVAHEDAAESARAHLIISQANHSLADFAASLQHATGALELFRALGDRSGESTALVAVGIVHRRRAELAAARCCFDQALAIGREISDGRVQSFALNGLGSINRVAGDFGLALEQHGGALRHATEAGRREEEAFALIGLGNTYERLGRYTEALECYRSALGIGEEINHPQLLAYANGNIAIIHERHGDNTSALRYELISLRWKEKLQDMWGMGVSLNNLGLIYLNLGDYARALEAMLGSLEITERIGDREGESVALNNIGQIYDALGDMTNVLDYFLRSLRISREIGDTPGEAFSLTHIGRFYESLGDLPRALMHFYKALRIHEASGERYGERGVLHSIGSVFFTIGDTDRAADFYGRALALAESIGDRQGEANSLISMAMLYHKLLRYTSAIEALKRARTIAGEMENRDLTAQTLYHLAEICAAHGDHAKSSKYRRAYQEVVRQSFNSDTTRRVGELLHNFERNTVRRQGELLGLSDEDLTTINDVVRKSVRVDLSVPRHDDVPNPGASPAIPRPEARADSPATIEVITFGEFRVIVGGRRLSKGDWNRKRARDLFKLLLVHHRRALTIDEIVDKLWRGTNDRNMEMLVMNAVSHIRKALEPGRSPHSTTSALVSLDRAYMLDLGEHASIDFLRFKELIVAARRGVTAGERCRIYGAAMDLYADDFLKEDYYEEWTDSERELLKDGFLEAVEYLAGEHLRNGASDLAIELARRALRHDNTSERAYEILLLGLRARGRMGESLKVLEECTSLFRSELGLEPPERLRRFAGASAV